MRAAFALLALALAAPAAAKDIRAADDGSGDYRTLAKALDAAVPGDIVVIKKASGMVGAILKLDKGAFLVEGTVPGSPAESAGLKKGEAIVAVDGVSSSSRTLADVVGAIRGAVGTRVTLTVAGASGARSVEITRGESRLPVKDDLGKAYIAHDAGDLETAARYAKKSAESGDPAGQAFLAALYYYGKGLKPDRVAAFTWAAKAAKAGDAAGQRIMGVLYKNGGGGAPKDEHLSVYWLQKAVDGGDAYAMTFLARAYEDGAGVVADRKKAAELYRRALALTLSAEAASDARARLARLEGE